MIEYAPRAKKVEDRASAAVAGSSTTASTTYVVGTALGGGDGSSLADKLRELQTARDEEILTESEFQELRQNAIASLMTNGSSDVAPFVSQQPTTGPAAAAEQSAPVVPIPMERGQNGPCESREAARATIRADKYSISAFSLNGIWCGLCCLVFPWCGTLYAVDEDTYVRHLQCLVWPLLPVPPIGSAAWVRFNAYSAASTG